MLREPTRQRPNPVPLPLTAGAAAGERAAPLPPPAGAAAGERTAIIVVGCRQRVSGPAPTRAEQSDAIPPPLPALPLPLPPLPKQLGCCTLPFFVWKLGSGGKLFGELFV